MLAITKRVNTNENDVYFKIAYNKKFEENVEKWRYKAMADNDKGKRINAFLVRLPLFTPRGWKCITAIVFMIVVGVSLS